MTFKTGFADPRSQLQRAEQLLRSGQFDQAAQLCRSVLAGNSRQPVALQILGIALAQSGDRAGAEAAIAKFLEINPKAAGAHVNLANLRLLKGDARGAEESYRTALSLAPGHVEALFNLGLALKAQDRLMDSLSALNKAIEIKPDYVDAITQSGIVLAAMNNLAAAADSFHRAIALRDDQFEAHYNLGLTYYRLDRLEEAKMSLARAGALNDRSAETFLTLGRTLHKLQQLGLATSALARAAALKPDSAEAHGLLAVVFLEDGWTKAATDEIGKAVALDPDNEQYHITRGRILADLNRLEEAEAANRRAVELAPASALALSALGRTHMSVGRMEDARAVFERSLALNGDTLLPHLDMARIGKFKADDPRLPQLEAFVATEDWLTIADRTALHFTLGRAYDEIGDFDRAFGHFRIANETQAAGHRDAEADDAAGFERTMAVYDSEFFRQHPAAGSSSQVPIFVVGMPRSGTTLIEQIVSSHPRVAGAGEVRDLEIATKMVASRHALSRDMPEMARDLSDIQWHELGDTYVERLRQRAAGSERVTDKLLGNYYRIGQIQMALPNAAIIHCKRNPVDCCVSIYTNHFVERQEHVNDLGRLGRYYRGYHDLMAHWRKVLPGRFLDVQYEDTVEDVEAVARRVIAWCGLEWDARCLEFQKNERRVATLSITQVRQPVYRSSLQRWRHYERHLGPLLEGLGPLADSATG